jgi:hypothetical protein
MGGKAESGKQKAETGDQEKHFGLRISDFEIKNPRGAGS